MPFVHLDALPKHVSRPGMTISFVHAYHMSFVYRHLEAGVGLAEHAHRQEQVVHVLEGTLAFTVAGDTYQLGPEMIAGIAVQMISSRVLPWIGGPSFSSSPGRMR